MDDVELEFTDDALQVIAEKALERKTGARGLRSILESTLLDLMYELPSLRDVSKVVINAQVITGLAQPVLVYKPDGQRQAGAD